MIEARYVYEDARGQPRVKKLRFTGKRFQLKSASWRDREGRWHFVPRVRDDQWGFWVRSLYRLPEVVAALKACEPVWWCEGEKDADSVADVGACATTTPNPSKLHDDQARWFAKYRSTSPVYVVCDHDEHGGWWGWERYAALLRVGVAPERIAVVAPLFPGCKDITDHLEMGFPLSAARRVDLGRLQAVAERYGAARAARYGVSPTPTARKPDLTRPQGRSQSRRPRQNESPSRRDWGSRHLPGSA